MKVLFSNLSLSDNRINYQRPKTQVHNLSTCSKSASLNEVTNSPALTFCAKPDSTMLLSQSDKLLCAYSRKPMLSPFKLRSIYAKLAKKTNAQSAINFLKEYREYMPSVETEIFDMFEEYKPKGKTTFQDILIEKRSESLTKLRQKQTNVLHSADDYILGLDGNLSEDLLYIRDVALLKVNDGTFGRSDVLEQLETLREKYTKTDECGQNCTKTLEQNERHINKIYKIWYNLPRALKDYDAFIVKYSKFSHNDIAQRLLNMSVASVEHIKPYVNGGWDILWNYVLTQMLYNQDKGDMRLVEYDECNPDIGVKENLPKYIEDVCNEIKRGNPYFEANYLYPKQLGQTIALETGWNSFFNIVPDDPRNLKKKSQITRSQKGKNRYIINHK